MKTKTKKVDVRETAANVIRDARIAEGMTQFQADVACDLPLGTFGQLENQYRMPGFETTRKIVAVIDLDLYALYGVDK